MGVYMYNDLPPENIYGHTKKVKLFREAIERCRLQRGGGCLRILDIGCGSGYAVTRFLGRVGDDVLGVDMFPPNINYAVARYQRDGLRFACVDASALQLQGKQFDVVVMADVLEHLDDPAAVLRTAVKLLSPGAHVLVTIPNGRGPFEIESAISRAPMLGPALVRTTDLLVALLNKTILRGAWSRAMGAVSPDLPYNEESGHVQFFSQSGLVALCASAGLELAMLRNLSFISGPFSNYLFAPFRRLCDWNARVADYLPSWCASAWLFEFKVNNRCV